MNNATSYYGSSLISSSTTNPFKLAGPTVRDTAQEMSARYYLNAGWTCSVSGWNYLPAASIAIAQDVPVSFNATLSSTNGSVINFNTTTGRLFYPKSGKIRINAFAASNASVSTSNPYELRICVYGSPAWTATGQAAKTYGATAGSANNLAGTQAACLKYQNLVTNGIESGIEWSGIVSAGTEIILLVYAGGGTSMTFPTSGIYFDTGYDYFLSP